MENAGAGAARVAETLLGRSNASIACLCGPGNNGGDAMVVARHLSLSGHAPVLVRLTRDSGGAPRGDAGVQLAICRAMGLAEVPVSGPDDLDEVVPLLEEAHLLVDGLFGTGLVRPLETPASDLVDAANASGTAILALDLPSGLDCDTGEPLGTCVRADATATFVGPKLAFANDASRRYVGTVHVVGIGAPA